MGQRLDNFLGRILGDVPESLIFRVIRKGEVRVNGKRAKPETRLQASDIVRVPPVRTGAAHHRDARPTHWSRASPAPSCTRIRGCW